ncbi:chitinase [Planomonospora sp. ID91781]|uniref:glycoside hydrolase family 19 protein n=1 Tax=Planomonospora sp. ID91781 TaxID=2738135 RepID=UPI0018C39E45|nr:glycoside hydrolase family 19 protein [Planomonospora sp. ID91781]MBG0823126.1 chitinase [Planomonospora sp. ID91781]
MARNRIVVSLSAMAVAGGLVAGLPASAAVAASPAVTPICASEWNPAKAYAGGLVASYGGRNWRAKWWNQNNVPGGSSGNWTDKGACEANEGNFVVTEAQFEEMFKERNPFYTYSGLVTALSAYPEFAATGSDTVKKQEAAAFLANISHETGGLRHIVEVNTANYSHYCEPAKPYGCPAGLSSYYGRGPIQLSWNFNYKAAGDALEIDLLNNPDLVQKEASVAWMTAIWYWMTQNGPGTMTPHAAMVGGHGFGETIRSINGRLECDGANSRQVENRVRLYLEFTGILGVDPGSGLRC